MPDALPIDTVLPELVAKLRASGAVVLQAPTGAGKTTRVPPAILEAKGEVLLLEPRRVAARAAARRMAFEHGSKLGDRFGYQVRFDNCSCRNTRVLVVTPGILLRRLQDDPYLETVAAVVFDEFHERGLESDLALGMVKLIRENVRPDLRVVVMSATLDTQPLSDYLGGCPVVKSEGRSYPVTIRYSPRRVETPVPEAAASAVRAAMTESDGDVLVFLPGLREIRQTEDRLQGVNAEVMLLHGELPPEQQDRALQKLQHRKIVLATNVAETSVTVDGVTVVIDSGLARQMEFDASVGMDRLVLKPIAKSSADQRAGRAGRTQPGTCIRLWDETSHRGRLSQTEPEIRRVDLCNAVLNLLSFGEADVSRFPWLDAPRAEAVKQSLQLLERLGAIDATGLTDIGRTMAALPVAPRLGRMMVEATLLGNVPEAALAAAILADRDPFDRDYNSPVIATSSDLLDRVEALVDFSRSGRMDFAVGRLHREGAKNVLRAAEQLMVSRDAEGRRSGAFLRDHAPLRQASASRLNEAIFAAYPDRLCKRRNPNDRRALMVGGRGVKLAPCSGVLEPDLFVAIDVDAGGVESLVRMASEVRREWLSKDRLATKHEIEFDANAQKLVCFKRTRFDGMVIDETPGHFKADDDNAARILAIAAKEVRPASDSAAGQLLLRLQCLKVWRPDLDLPVFGDADLQAMLPELCRGCRSLNDVKAANWLDCVRNAFAWPQWQRLESEAPATITVPSGREVELVYEAGRPPILAAKVQELFGLKETPRLVGGTVKVLVHLLAPNGRPQQVTDDLASFWANTYTLVRKDLRNKYPKHDWPEDPYTAIASRGVRRRDV